MKPLQVVSQIFLVALCMIQAGGSSDLPLPLTLKKISKTSPMDQGKIPYTFTISCDSEVSNIDHITLALIKQMEDPSIENIFENREFQEIPTSENFTISYLVPVDALDDYIVVIITAHDSNRVPLASVKQGMQIPEIAPTMNWVGPNGDSLRIKTDIDIRINNRECKNGPSPCYFIQYDIGSSLEVCTPAIDAIDKMSELTDTFLCDNTLTIGGSEELTSVRSIQLTYPDATSNDTLSMKVSAEYQDTSTKMEVVLYTGEDVMSFSSCDLYDADTNAIKNCTLLNVTVNTTEDIFSILMVTLGKTEEVIESASIDFEDYKPQPISITSDIIYLTFSAKDKTTYKIYLNKEVPDGYRDVKVICGGDEVDKCTTYFLDLESPTYVVSVKKNERGDLNIVEGTVTMISEEDPMICYPQDEESSRNKSKEMMQLTHRQKEE